MATFRSFRPRPEAATHRENRFAGPGLSLPRHPPAVRALATRRPVLVSMKDARMSSNFRIHMSFPPVLVVERGVLR